MESTGVYWIPAYETLQQRGFEVVLVNARDAKHVPGRKTDVSDAQWLRRLHEFGLMRASFRPKGELAALRAYLRQRERLPDYSASHVQHMLLRLPGEIRARKGHRQGQHRDLVRRRGAHRSEEQDHKTMGQAGLASVGAQRSAHRFNLHIRRDLQA
jgi:transposase